MMLEKILVADDEQIMRKFLAEALRRRQIEMVGVADGREAVRLLENDPSFDLVISDIKMPGLDGISLLRRTKELYPDLPVIMMTAYGTIESAVEAMKMGAEDYLLKPFSPDQIELMLKRIEDRRTLIDENKYLRQEIDRQHGFGEIVGVSSRMQNIYQMVTKVAASKATVLIQGESGTGKELIARAIHYNSPRRERPFIKVNCAALTETLLESELFGHEKGAFTGAVFKRAGRFELAHTGTLLLDEVSEISTSVQAKLLRVLQEREFERVGGTKPIRVDVRVLGTTNRDLRQAIRQGTFREDLFFRLNVIPVTLPALRERTEDVALLAEYFLDQFNRENKKKPIKISRAAMDILSAYAWPGNVRELENLMERLVVLDIGETLLPEHLPMDIFAQAGRIEPPAPATVSASAQSLSDMEREMILSTLKKMNGNRTKTADALGISVRTLRNKLSLYKTDPATPVLA